MCLLHNTPGHAAQLLQQRQQSTAQIKDKHICGPRQARQTGGPLQPSCRFTHMASCGQQVESPPDQKLDSNAAMAAPANSRKSSRHGKSQPLKPGLTQC